MLMKMSVDECVEDELRVLLVVAYLCLIRQPFSFLSQVQTYRIDTGTVVVERIEIAGAVDAALW